MCSRATWGHDADRYLYMCCCSLRHWIQVLSTPLLLPPWLLFCCSVSLHLLSDVPIGSVTNKCHRESAVDGTCEDISSSSISSLLSQRSLVTPHWRRIHRAPRTGPSPDFMALVRTRSVPTTTAATIQLRRRTIIPTDECGLYCHKTPLL
ncbi:hypothetical protein L227DRAFT_276053 [Lentinus tigrinus ALCF2SS1-6]|uniref:Uncharacterized protein n=1 Tax=Lentinus tigrinus ALCF2SS1-6 TaxID=1328759 RepID=A0A5C2SMZ7_9APHY|nr:hypothetical protein L227DRAFT_276053 [Lentinus tigrinus ALCF2SS1-6]